MTNKQTDYCDGDRPLTRQRQRQLVCIQTRRWRRGSFFGRPSFAPHPQHDAMLDVEQDLLLLAVVPDEGVQRVAVRHPANQARVGGQRDDGVALDADGGKESFILLGSVQERGQFTSHRQSTLAAQSRQFCLCRVMCDVVDVCSSARVQLVTQLGLCAIGTVQ